MDLDGVWMGVVSGGWVVVGVVWVILVIVVGWGVGLIAASCCEEDGDGVGLGVWVVMSGVEAGLGVDD